MIQSTPIPARPSTALEVVLSEWGTVNRLAGRHPDLIPRPFDKDDLVQEAAFIALRYAPRFDPDRHPPAMVAAWLVKKARFSLYRLSRRAKRSGRTVRLAQPVRDRAPQPATTAESRETVALVRGVVDRLPPRQREYATRRLDGGVGRSCPSTYTRTKNALRPLAERLGIAS